jgi:hypothetical protein
MLDLNKKRTVQELKTLLDNVKVSDLTANEKAKLIDEIEFKITGRRFTDVEILKDIEESQADISDIN